MAIQIEIKREDYKSAQEITAPAKATSGDAGFDLQATESSAIYPGKVTMVPTGFAWKIPEGHVGFVCPRSGLAARYGVTVANAPGVVDSSYRGEVKVLLTSYSDTPHFIAKGDRIGQMVVVPIIDCENVLEVLDLGETERGAGGFGHTGK